MRLRKSGFFLIFLFCTCSCSTVTVKPDLSVNHNLQPPEPYIREVSGADYLVKGNVYWFKPISFKAACPDGWDIFEQQGFNPKVVFSRRNKNAQSEIYWVSLFEAANLAVFADEFCKKSAFNAGPPERITHPDGEMLSFSFDTASESRVLFFLKKRKRVFIISCACGLGRLAEYERDFFYIAENFRLFDGYKIK